MLFLETVLLAGADGGFFSDITDGGCIVVKHAVSFIAISESNVWQLMISIRKRHMICHKIQYHLQSWPAMNWHILGG